MVRSCPIVAGLILGQFALPSGGLVLRGNATAYPNNDLSPDHKEYLNAADCELKFGMCLYPCTCVRFIHFNDVYTFYPGKPSSAGKYWIRDFEGSRDAMGTFDLMDLESDPKRVPPRILGSMPHAKSVLKNMKDNAVEENFVPIVTFGGDLLGPSFLSMFETAGFHMVEALNEMEIDMTNWGNHEFDQGAENGLRAVRCSRYAWLTANVKEIYRGGYEGGLIGSNYLHKGSDWAPRMSVLDGYDFPYQPGNGVLEVVIDSTIGPITRPAVKLCFGGLTTDDSRTKAYINSFMPANSFARRFKIPDDGRMYSRWRPSHMPVGVKYGDMVAVDDLYNACPVHTTAGKQLVQAKLFESELSIRESEVGQESFSYYLDWERVMPTMLDEAWKANCDSFIVVTHLKFLDDCDVVGLDHPRSYLVRFSAGGHDHEPHIYMAYLNRMDGARQGYEMGSRSDNEFKKLWKLSKPAFTPVRNYMYPDKLHVKIGMDSQFIAKIDFVFMTKLGSRARYQYMKFNFAPKHMEWDDSCKDRDEDDCERNQGKPMPIFHDVIRVNPLYETEDMAMKGLMVAFEELTRDLKEKKIAKRWMGVYNTVQIRKRQTRTGDFFMDIVRGWSLEKQEAKSLTMLRLVTLVNSGAIRSGLYADMEYPEGRAYSMLEIKADWPIPNRIHMWMVSAEDLQIGAMVYAADQGDGMFGMWAGMDITYEVRKGPKRIAFLTDKPSAQANEREVIMTSIWNGGPEDEYLMNIFKPCEAVLMTGIEFIRGSLRKTIQATWDAIGQLDTQLKDVTNKAMITENTPQINDNGPLRMKRKLREDTLADGGKRTASIKKSHDNIMKTGMVGIIDLIVDEIKDFYSPTGSEVDLLPILSGLDCDNPTLHNAQVLGSWHAAAKGLRTPCSRARIAMATEIPVATDDDQGHAAKNGGLEGGTDENAFEDVGKQGEISEQLRFQAMLSEESKKAAEAAEKIAEGPGGVIGKHIVAVRKWARKYAINFQEEQWQQAVNSNGGKAKPFLKLVPWRDVRRILDLNNWKRYVTEVIDTNGDKKAFCPDED